MALFEAEVYVVRDTPKALLVFYEGEEIWIPKSQIHSNSEVWDAEHIGETGNLVIPEWLAEEKGML